MEGTFGMAWECKDLVMDMELDVGIVEAESCLEWE